MKRRTLAALLSLLLTASVLLVLVPAQAHVASSPVTAAPVVPETVHPAAGITPTILNGYDGTTSDFYPGVIGFGSFDFIVTDTLDHDVNVTITDPNAARDGVASPAWHYEAVLNTTTSTFDSYTKGVSYTFPASVPYGGKWLVNFSAPNAGHVDENITLFLYTTSLSTSVGSGATLPGELVSVFWSLYLYANEVGLYTRATNVWIVGHYEGNGTTQPLFRTGPVALTPASAGQGGWTGMVPLNTTPDSQLHFEVYAITNVSGIVAENESANITINVGALVIDDWGITNPPPVCAFGNTVYFATGSLIASCVLAGANYLGAFTPISGLPVSINYWNGTAHVTPAGAPTALTTNASGEAAFTFLASVPPFIQENQYPTYNALNFTVKVPGASTLYHWTVWLNETWYLYGESSASGVVEVALDHTQYYAGDTATVTWSISSTNLTKTGPITASRWIVVGTNGVVFNGGNLSRTAQSGTFTFPITSAMVSKIIYVEVFATNATEPFVGYATAFVLGPSLLLTASSAYYTAGSTVSVLAVLNGGGAGATIQYEVLGVWEYTEGTLSSGTVANDSNIPVVVPSATPPLELEVEAWASVGGQVIANKVVELELAQGYTIQLGVTTASSYSDGSYQPGQTVTLSYAVVATPGTALPQVVSFELFAVGYAFAHLIENVGLSGTIPFTIPSNAVQGTLLVELAAEGALDAGPCLPTGSCVGIAAIPINPHPSFLSMELGAGSGLTVGWLILLVLIFVVAIVLYLALRRRGRVGPAMTTASGMNPPAPPPSTPPASEWKEPPTQAPPSEGPPSSPQPPPGAS